MKKGILISLALLSSFNFIRIAFAQAEDSGFKAQVEQLKKTVGELEKKIDSLEQNQNAQEQKTEKIAQLEESVKELEDSAFVFDSQGIDMGGHIKLYMYDQSQGKRNEAKQRTNISAGVSGLYLYFRKEINDWLNMEVSPEIDVTAAATPTLGSNMSRATTGSTSASLHKAFFIARMDNSVEVKVGLFNPLFSEEYANETWWEEIYNKNYALAVLQSWHDSGIEIYKNIDFSQWSLPLYFYLLNGNSSYRGQFVDNNESKTVLLHIGPEFFQSRLRLLGSLGMGRWDNNDDYNAAQSAWGAECKLNNWQFSGEYLYRKWHERPLAVSGTQDAKRQGYYLKTIYNFSPKWRSIFIYSDVDLYYAANTQMLTDNYDNLTFALNYLIEEASVIIAEISFVDGARPDAGESINFYRLTLGWKTTF
ncbi:MAG: hypothetical protein HY810_07850 [Candidatus Omnitrophica bacterium]|nr:hypothetical protein [Candidatus Omnitrophota bacterium]